jgi:hypothetical protein
MRPAFVGAMDVHVEVVGSNTSADVVPPIMICSEMPPATRTRPSERRVPAASTRPVAGGGCSCQSPVPSSAPPAGDAASSSTPRAATSRLGAIRRMLHRSDGSV